VAIVGACVASVLIGLAVLIPILTIQNESKNSDTTNRAGNRGEDFFLHVYTIIGVNFVDRCVESIRCTMSPNERNLNYKLIFEQKLAFFIR
jgi:hypothetical protein